MIFVNAKFLIKPITGIERYATEISYALKKTDSSIVFLTPEFDSNQSNVTQLRPVKIKPFKEYFWEQITLSCYLYKKNNPLLINLTNTAPLLLKNQLLVIHDLAFIYEPSWYTRKAALAFKFLVRNSAKVSGRIITVSNFTKQEVIKYLKIPSEKITVIPGAVPRYIYKYKDKSFNNVYGDYVLSVSSIEPRKNISNLIKAFAKLNRSNLKLVIAGKTNSKVFNMAGIDIPVNKDIILTGYVSDEELVGLYKNAMLFVYLSYYEGFGFPPLEAIACGCPTLVSNTSSLPEVCGNFAHYCNPFDVNDITSMMELILNGKNKDLELYAEQLKQKYSWEKSATMILELAKELNQTKKSLKV